MIFAVSCGQKSKSDSQGSSSSLKIKTIAVEETIKAELPYDPLTMDEGVVINGVKWATRNIAAPGTFAATTEDAGMFYKWNNKKAWATIGDEVTDWDNSIYDGDAWVKSNDPSPAGWHVPTDRKSVV